MSLASIAVFRGMTGETLSQLERGSTIQEPCDGATIFAQGDPSDAVYSIIGGDGHVRIGAIDRNGKALMVEVLRVGEIRRNGRDRRLSPFSSRGGRRQSEAGEDP